ncbi:MAG: cytochrome c5 family protein, partial [Betaproteobacteria bacterium]|nr:cytochrome c5 family protein [Betaproteobacteria bacterium]
MSDHDSPIKTPKQLILAVALGFIVPIVVIVLLTKYIGAQTRSGACLLYTSPSP